MITTDEIKKMIEAVIPGAQVRVSDMTGTGDHFEIHVASSAFKDRTLLEQHKMVFDALEREMDNRIHAAQLKTKII